MAANIKLPPPAASGPRAWALWLLVVVLGLVAGGAILAFANRPPEAVALPAPVARPTAVPKPEGSTSPKGASVLARGMNDQEGRLTRIEGNDPGAVLGFYCAEGGAFDPRTPIGIRAAPVPGRGVRVGVLRRGGDQRDYAIWIRLDDRTGKWFVGNGLDPVSAYLLSERAF